MTVRGQLGWLLPALAATAIAAVPGCSGPRRQAERPSQQVDSGSRSSDSSVLSDALRGPEQRLDGHMVDGHESPQPGADAPMDSPVADAPPGRANGSACARDSECDSKICIDGLCCSQVCPACQKCDGPNGGCQFTPYNLEDLSLPNQCAGGKVCDGQGGCKVATGQACTAGDTCVGLGCVLGFCCSNNQCQAPCESCAHSSTRTCARFSNVRVPGCDGPSKICIGFNERCGTIDVRVDGPASPPVALGENTFAQIIATDPKGTLVAVRLRLSCSSNALVTVQVVYNVGAEPVGQVLQGVEVQMRGMDLRPTEPGVDDFVLLPFKGGAVMSGVKYALLVRADDGTCQLGVSQSAETPGGARFVRPRSGGPWQRQEGSLLFQLVVTP